MANVRLIDANALLREMRHSGRAAYMLVMDAPTIDPETLLPVAHWVNEEDAVGDPIIWTRSNCKESIVMYDGAPMENGYKYCPMCGARTEDATNEQIDAFPEAEPCLNWHPASELPPLHHEVDENKCEGTIECDVSEPLLLYTEEEGYKVGVYMKDCYGFDGWLNPDYGGTIRHVVEWQYPPKKKKKKS